MWLAVLIEFAIVMSFAAPVLEAVNWLSLFVPPTVPILIAPAPALNVRLLLFATLLFVVPIVNAPPAEFRLLLPATVSAPTFNRLPLVFTVPDTVVVLAVLVKPPLKFSVSPPLPRVTPFALLNVTAFVKVFVPPLKTTAYGWPNVVKPPRVTLLPKVTVPFADVLFCRLSVLLAPVTVLLKFTALLPPFPESTVRLLFTFTGPFILIMPPAVDTFAPDWITPVPTGVMVIVPVPEEDTAPFNKMSRLPTLPNKEILPVAATVAPDFTSIAAVEVAPVKPFRLEPLMVKLPLTLIEPVAVTSTPPTSLPSASPVSVRLEPAPVVVSAPFTVR